MRRYGVYWNGNNQGYVVISGTTEPQRFTKEEAETYAREGNLWVRENLNTDGHYSVSKLEVK